MVKISAQPGGIDSFNVGHCGCDQGEREIHTTTTDGVCGVVVSGVVCVWCSVWGVCSV